MITLCHFSNACHLVDLPQQIERCLQAEFSDPIIDLLLLGLLDFGPMFRLQGE